MWNIIHIMEDSLMKVLVLNGSPKEKSDTMCLTNAFLKGLNKENGFDIHSCLSNAESFSLDLAAVENPEEMRAHRGFRRGSAGTKRR